MLRFFSSFAFCLALAYGQTSPDVKVPTPKLSTGSKIYIPPMNGFENYLASAIVAKKVPITVVLDQGQADYVVKGSWRESNGGTSGNGSLVRPLKQRVNYSASISIIDPKSSAVLFSYAAQRSGTHDLSKEVAEDWAAKLLRELSSKDK